LSKDWSAARQSAFTLVEVLVALVVGGLATLGAQSVLGAIADHTDRISEATGAADRRANGERALRALLAGLEIGTTKDATFGGDEREARFTTWCSTPSGWQERCTVRLAVLPADSVDAKSILASVLSTGEILPLVEGPDVRSIRYLRDAANGGTWFYRWGTGITAPVGIGIITAHDTLIVRIGERG
jgi:prepilin-type N-terminal cleavage/methylation domain-containing protein